ncbi:MAG: hypothetical protein OEV23_08480 [Gallionella sp.]|nr:hypothetical protein [Gallionella sp.]
MHSQNKFVWKFETAQININEGGMMGSFFAARDFAVSACKSKIERRIPTQKQVREWFGSVPNIGVRIRAVIGLTHVLLFYFRGNGLICQTQR